MLLQFPDTVLREVLSFVSYRDYSMVCRRLRQFHSGRPVAVRHLPPEFEDERWLLAVPLLRDAASVTLADCSNEKRRARFVKRLLPSLFPDEDEDALRYKDPEPERLQEAFPQHPPDLPKPEYTLRPVSVTFRGSVAGALQGPQRQDLSDHLLRLELADLRLSTDSVNALQRLTRLQVLGLSMVLPPMNDGHPSQLKLRRFSELRELYLVEPEQLAQRCVDASQLSTRLQRLHLSLSALMPDELFGLSRLTGLQELALVQAGLPDDWEQAVRPLSRLEVLDLRWCAPPLSDRNAARLFAPSTERAADDGSGDQHRRARRRPDATGGGRRRRPFPRLRKLLLSGFAGSHHVTQWHSVFVETFWRACLMIDNAPVTGTQLTARGLASILNATHGQLETLAMESSSLLRGSRPARLLARETQLRELNVAWHGGGPNFGIDERSESSLSSSSSDDDEAVRYEEMGEGEPGYGKSKASDSRGPTEDGPLQLQEFRWLRRMPRLFALSVAPVPLTSSKIERALHPSCPLLAMIKDER